MATPAAIQAFFTSSRGKRLSTVQWLPPQAEPSALLFLLHGYAVDCANFWADTGSRLSAAGFGVFGVEMEGHGQSEGLPGLLLSLDDAVADAAEFFKSVREKPEYAQKKRFVMGESMGGAMAILLSWKEPGVWDGLVLVAPMCKISEKMKPPAPVIAVLKLLARIFPSWAATPVDDVTEKANRDPAKREKIQGYPTTYMGKTRLGTALALLRASDYIEARLPEVTAPFLVLHGSADTVTDPDISQELYDKAQSTDKTIKIYPGMWHGLTAGELDENIDSVLADIISWINKRS